MGIEDKFWLLEDDEDLSFERGRFYELRGGLILDGRTSEPLGTYTVNEQGADLLFNETYGDRRILKFRMPHSVQEMWGGRFKTVEQPFDPDAPSYSVNFSSEKWDAYDAAHPKVDEETEEQAIAREQWEEEANPLHRTFGLVYRDHPEVVQMGMNLDRECAVRMRREAMKVV